MMVCKQRRDKPGMRLEAHSDPPKLPVHTDDIISKFLPGVSIRVLSQCVYSVRPSVDGL